MPVQSIYWIDLAQPGRLGIAARPAGHSQLADEMAAWAEAGVNRVLRLLEPAEIHELGLGDQPAHCMAFGIALTDFPIRDRGLPDNAVRARSLALDVASGIAGGETVVIHCRAGIGRSSVMAATAMIALGTAPEEAFARIAAARGVRVPDTDAQRDWVLN